MQVHALPQNDRYCQMNLCNLSPARREAIEQDKQRWQLANKMASSQSAEQIKRWLDSQADAGYAEDMARRLRICWKNKVKII